jgi:hypothetical protein
MIDPAARKQALALGREAHALTETAYRADRAIKGGPGWDDKQRILMADMSLHLLQTSLQEGELDLGRLKQNLYAILTIASPFLPSHELARQAELLLQDGADLTIE